MQPIPTPQVLDPDRILADDRDDFTVHHRTREQLLDEALHATCAYAQQLWHDLDAMRAYLLDSLPPDPRAPGPHPTACASPVGPDDETGWANWISAYAAVTSVLCGPGGDSGYGLAEARREATLRRTAPVLHIHAEHPDAQHRVDQASVDDLGPKRRREGRSRTKRATGTAILVFLAVRGLRPRRRPYL
jgi:hypothetical protein